MRIHHDSVSNRQKPPFEGGHGTSGKGARSAGEDDQRDRLSIGGGGEGGRAKGPYRGHVSPEIWEGLKIKKVRWREDFQPWKLLGCRPEDRHVRAEPVRKGKAERSQGRW